MSSLTTKQRAHLKALAHALKPILQIGREGITDRTARALESAFETRELLKVKVLDASPLDASESAELLAERVAGVRVVQVIGKTLVLYRPDPERPGIELPT
jgi:RNA-binding protein